MSDTKLPSHAYLPGQNQRHAEDAFDAIRRTAEQHLDASQLAQSKAFLTGLVYLKEGFFWEAHEVLEPVWMVLPNGSIERQFVQGLIQLANGCLKLRMGRPKAALRLVGQTRALLPADQALTIMTLNLQEVHRWVDKLEADVDLVL